MSNSYAKYNQFFRLRNGNFLWKLNWKKKPHHLWDDGVKLGPAPKLNLLLGLEQPSDCQHHEAYPQR
jgi:hypothetical protein